MASGRQPAIAAIEPDEGFADGLTSAAIHGSGFTAGALVLVGAREATVLGVSPAGDRLDVAVPPSELRVPGRVAVEVVDPGGLSARRLGAFLYRDHLRLLSLAPDRAPQWGGVVVSLRGYGFRPGMAVSFGGTDSYEVRVSSPELATAKAPAHAGGLVDVTVRLARRGVTSPSQTQDFETWTL